MLRARSIMGNRQRLDGGAMFGNAPRPLWSRWLSPDADGRVDLACRALLLETDGRRILLETGIGVFFEPHLKDRYGVLEDTHVLLESLSAHGLSDADIDVVVLSHLHFDHAGGLLAPHAAGKPPRLLFPKAQYIVGHRAFERARKPHRRDRASFIPGLAPLLEESGRLRLVDPGDATSVLGPEFSFHLSDGHTPGLLLTEVRGKRATLCFCSDLAPGAAWVHLPITMGYDRFPEQLVDEKAQLLGRLAEEKAWLFFTHDPNTAAGRVVESNGRYGVTEQKASVEAWDLDEDTTGT
jgi:glyoxylase-like metal-dependent hydrolase (beta-lactamase superfamily II)